jgi:hypothetical protein
MSHAFVAAAVRGGRFGCHRVYDVKTQLSIQSTIGGQAARILLRRAGGRRPLQRQDTKEPSAYWYVERELEGGAGGDLADFGVFDDAAAELFDGGLQHGAADVVAVDVEVGERF